MHLTYSLSFSLPLSLPVLMTAVVFNSLNSSSLTYTIRLRHETPTRDPGKEKWYTHQRVPQVEPTGPRVYDK